MNESHNKNNVNEALKCISPNTDYNTWLGNVTNFKNAGIDFSAVEMWCRSGDGYKEDLASKWDTLPSDGDAEKSKRIIFAEAKKQGYSGATDGYAKGAQAQANNREDEIEFINHQKNPSEFLQMPKFECHTAAETAEKILKTLFTDKFVTTACYEDKKSGQYIIDSKTLSILDISEVDFEKLYSAPLPGGRYMIGNKINFAQYDSDIKTGIAKGIKKSHVVSYEWCLIEADEQIEMPDAIKRIEKNAVVSHEEMKSIYEWQKSNVEAQWQKFNELSLPCMCGIHSGGKSIHFICHIGAKNEAEYTQRVTLLMKYCAHFGFKVDPATKNINRFFRFPLCNRTRKITDDGKYKLVNMKQYPVYYNQNYIKFDEWAAASVKSNESQYEKFYKETNSKTIFHHTFKNGIVVNAELYQMAFNKYFIWSNDIIFSNDNSSWYTYESASGLWKQAENSAVQAKVSAELERVVEEHLLSNNYRYGYPKITSQLCHQLVDGVKGLCTKDNFFTVRAEMLIHCANGMMSLKNATPSILPFSKEYKSRNRTEIAYNPKAAVPHNFLAFLRDGLDTDADIELLQRYAGQCLLGENLSQTILLLQGMAGQGKSTLLKIISNIINKANCAELRVSQLGERFELSRFIGKTLLHAPDVPANFLNTPSAAELKSLCGGDVREVEFKNANGGKTITGTFNVIITSNSELKIRLEQDADAWLRRLLIVKYEKSGNAKPVPNLDAKLVAEEGEAILAWMVVGAQKLLADIESYGKIQLSDRQKDNVKKMLDLSNSVAVFASEIEADQNSVISTDELKKSYYAWAKDQGVEPESEKSLERKLPDILSKLYSALKYDHCTNVDGKRCKGYKGIRFKKKKEPVEVSPEAREILDDPFVRTVAEVFGARNVRIEKEW